MKRRAQDPTFDGRGLQDFLDQISEREADEIGQLRQRFENELRAIRSNARRASLDYHRRAAGTARNRIESDRQRKLSRARNEFRKQRWLLLETWRQRARQWIFDDLKERWKSVDQQKAWCRFWINQIDQLSDASQIRIIISADCDPGIQTLLADITQDIRPLPEIKTDTQMDSGIMIESELRQLDGRLCEQVESVLNEVYSRFATWVHAQPAEYDS